MTQHINASNADADANKDFYGYSEFRPVTAEDEPPRPRSNGVS